MNYFKFEPLLKQTLWGGDKIIPFKSLHENMENVGESWEISGVKDNETIAVGDGRSLNQLVRELKGQLVGLTTSALATSSPCSSSLSMPART